MCVCVCMREAVSRRTDDADKLHDGDAAEEDRERQHHPGQVNRLELQAEHECDDAVGVLARPVVDHHHDEAHAQDGHPPVQTERLREPRVREWRRGCVCARIVEETCVLRHRQYACVSVLCLCLCLCLAVCIHADT